MSNCTLIFLNGGACAKPESLACPGFCCLWHRDLHNQKLERAAIKLIPRVRLSEEEKKRRELAWRRKYQRRRRKKAKAALRAKRHLEIQEEKLALVQRRWEHLAKTLEREAMKQAKSLPRATQDYLRGFEDGRRFVLEGGQTVLPPVDRTAEEYFAKGFQEGQLSKLKPLVRALCFDCKENTEKSLNLPTSTN